MLQLSSPQTSLRFCPKQKLPTCIFRGRRRSRHIRAEIELFVEGHGAVEIYRVDDIRVEGRVDAVVHLEGFGGTGALVSGGGEDCYGEVGGLVVVGVRILGEDGEGKGEEEKERETSGEEGEIHLAVGCSCLGISNVQVVGNL